MVVNDFDKTMKNRQPEEKQGQGLLLHIGKLFIAGRSNDYSTECTARQSNVRQLLRCTSSTMYVRRLYIQYRQLCCWQLSPAPCDCDGLCVGLVEPSSGVLCL